MSLASILSRTHQGIDARSVQVEVNLSNGLPAFTIVGLPEAAVKESKDRVRAAIQNSQFEFPAKRITVNLAPADLPKTGAHFDLPIAVGILLASNQLRVNDINQYELIGELALSGELRGGKGVLPIALAAKNSNKTLILPSSNMQEANLVSEVQSVGANSLLDVCAYLSGQLSFTEGEKQANQIEIKNGGLSPCSDFADGRKQSSQQLDMAQVKGQAHAKRALEIAAAGGHNVLMVGPPGTGKSMLAARLSGILPKLKDQQAVETAAIQSISQQGFDTSLWRIRPYRHPHHTVSGIALIGGGANPMPGEVSLAHNGVLFLDELTEFNRNTLEVLREPIEAGYVNISRAGKQARYPAKFQLIAAMNPCPCGFLGDKNKECTCTPDKIERYKSKISGPLLDRIDMHLTLPRLKHEELASDLPQESSAEILKRVEQAQNVQMVRQGKLNAQLDTTGLEQHAKLCEQGVQLMQKTVDKLNLSPRGYHRVLRVARTIADLSGCENIELIHLSEAIGYRGSV